MFPFLHSTDIYPEWPVAALNHVPKDVAEEVQEALIALGAHSNAVELNDFSRCDTTPKLAELAYDACRAGQLSGFRTARSYFDVRTMQEAAGFMKMDEEGDWKCTRADTLYKSIECPVGYYKLIWNEYEASCADAGLACKQGYECFCKPCVLEVEVYQYIEDDPTSNNTNNTNDTNNTNNTNNTNDSGCEKMSLCGSVEQTKDITFRVNDNKQRDEVTVTVAMHLGQEIVAIPVNKVAPWTYEFHWAGDEIGEGILEIGIDGEEIPESPIRVEVVERQCELDYPGHNRVASEDGRCVCGVGTVDSIGKCVNPTVIAVVASLAGLFIAVGVGLFILRYNNRKGDAMWQVNVREIHFDDPVEIIGRGSFGVVMLAEYRGTKVAIKCAIKSSAKSGSTRGSYGGKGSLKTGSHSIGCASGSVSGSVKVNPRTTRNNSDSTNETCDIESPPDTVPDRKLDSMEARSKKSSEVLDLDFLVDDYGRKSKWAWLFPWMAKGGYQTRFNESILGNSASTTSKSMAAVICPWFNEKARRHDDFMSEMRVLSRLRHPCITTVMGAVVTHTHDPMLVMEYMEYGSLYDLLRNETMFLSGEIIMQVARDVSSSSLFPCRARS
jgi:guanylate cyclase